MRKKFSAATKSAVAMEALAKTHTINEIASKYDVHPTQVKTWRDQLKESAVELFSDKRRRDAKQTDLEAQLDELHRVIGKREAPPC